MAGSDEMFEFKCKLIEEIKMHPAIYDKAHLDHFRRNKKDQFSESVVGFLFQFSIKHMVITGKSSINYLTMAKICINICNTHTS